MFFMIAGNWLYGTGEALLITADIGQTPGTVLAQGIQNLTGDSIGWTSFYISVGVMLLWIPLRLKVGIGTVFNIILVSVSIDVMTLWTFSSSSPRGNICNCPGKCFLHSK
jgi:uncharacterized membrane protein YczE